MLFISFEGLDGSGKSTQIERLRARLNQDGIDNMCVREPGGTGLSEQIRTLLLTSDLDISSYAELLLFSAARAQLVREVIRPALQGGTVVICDRFFDSTTAYQGGGRRIENVSWMNEFHRHVTDNLVPKRTYYLKLTPDDAFRRRMTRVGDVSEQDRMEGAGKAFFSRVAEAYDTLAKSEPDRFCILDATAPVERIAQLIWKDVESLLAR